MMLRFQMVLRNAWKLLRERGIVYTTKHSLRWVISKIEERGVSIFDKKYGTDTGGGIEWEKLKSAEHVNQDIGIGYRCAPKRTVIRSLKSLPIDYRDYVFVDFGSGKGSVLLYASCFPFKKIIGVEIFKLLHLVAEKNVSVYREEQQKCHDISCLCMNALDFEIPKDPIVCYLFNPFPRDLIEALLNKISKSLLEVKRPVWIIYQNPILSAVFDECEFLSLKARYIIPIYDRWNYAIYKAE